MTTLAIPPVTMITCRHCRTSTVLHDPDVAHKPISQMQGSAFVLQHLHVDEMPLEATMEQRFEVGAL